jgi:glyoxylase-like metal-dependent hydrolase (beta-lactamase superfamily II)
VAASPAGVIEPALSAVGLHLSEVRWILATHGHWDHIGGAHAARALTGDVARVAIHAKDTPLLRERRAHLDGYFGLRFRYLDDPKALAEQEAVLMENISGELAADRVLAEGDRVNLGRGTSLDVAHTPGHTAGSATYVLGGLDWAFVGDAVQVCGSSGSRFPLIADPVAYRGSIRRLRDELRPARLFLGHRFLDPSGKALDAQLEGEDVQAALRASQEMEGRLAAAADRISRGDGATAFAPAAVALGYSPDNPANWPPPFFTTLSGYLGQP